MSNTGYLVIADITGYTAYLSRTELDHAQEILESLLNNLIENTRPPLTIAKVEGDAVFSYALEGSFLQGQTLVESIEKLYCNFAETLEKMRINTTCTCNACRLMPTLDLKLVAHYGSFGIQRLGGLAELVGTDVNLVHRLLKNHIPDETGVKAYAFFTQACVAALALGEFVDLLLPHREQYEHIGEVSGYVYDLKPVWQRERERRRVLIRPEEADMIIEFDLPVPPPLAWEYLNDPDSKRRYRLVKEVGKSGTKNGRTTVGTVHHCVHGKEYTNEMIVDWQPFEYVTYENTSHNILPGGKTFTQLMTTRLTPIPEGTQVTMLISLPDSPDRLSRTMARFIWKMARKQVYHDMAEVSPRLLREMISSDLDNGKIRFEQFPPQTAPLAAGV